MYRDAYVDTSPAGLVVLGVIAIVWAIAWWNVFAKTGGSGAYGLLMLIPIVNVIVFLVFAFSKWPVQKQLDELRARIAMEPPAA